MRRKGLTSKKWQSNDRNAHHTKPAAERERGEEGREERMPPMGGGKERGMNTTEKTVESILRCMNGISKAEARIVLQSVEQRLDDVAVINFGNNQQEEKSGDNPSSAMQDAVMGIKGEMFTLGMELLHDLSGHFRGESYTVTIDVTPDWVMVKKTPKA